MFGFLNKETSYDASLYSFNACNAFWCLIRNSWFGLSFLHIVRNDSFPNLEALASNSYNISSSFLLSTSYLLIYIQLPPDANDFIRFLSLFLPVTLPFVFAILWYSVNEFSAICSKGGKSDFLGKRLGMNFCHLWSKIRTKSPIGFVGILLYSKSTLINVLSRQWCGLLLFFSFLWSNLIYVDLTISPNILYIVYELKYLSHLL